MSSFTTAVVSAGPKFLHPWGDRQWRISLTLQHVTGSSSDYWLVTATEPVSQKVSSNSVLIADPSHVGLLDSLVFSLALHLGGEQVEGYLLDHHNISVKDGVRVSAEYWELTDKTRAYLAGEVGKYVRLGITILDDVSPVDPSIVRDLRNLGFDVDVYRLFDGASVA